MIESAVSAAAEAVVGGVAADVVAGEAAVPANKVMLECRAAVK